MGENGQNDNTKYNEHTETGTSSIKNNQTQSQTQQSQQTTTNRFADYFVICGLDLDTGLEPDRIAGTYSIYTHAIQLWVNAHLIAKCSIISSILDKITRFANNNNNKIHWMLNSYRWFSVRFSYYRAHFHCVYKE